LKMYVLTSTELELEFLWRFPSAGPRRVRMSAEEIRARVRFKQISKNTGRERQSDLRLHCRRLSSSWPPGEVRRAHGAAASRAGSIGAAARGAQAPCATVTMAGSRPCDRTPSLDGVRPGPASSHEPALGRRAGGTRPQLAGHNAGKRAEARGYHHRKATASPDPRAAGLAALSSCAKSN
jgi:hypothetical protein